MWGRGRRGYLLSWMMGAGGCGMAAGSSFLLSSHLLPRSSHSGILWESSCNTRRPSQAYLQILRRTVPGLEPEMLGSSPADPQIGVLHRTD